MMILGKKVKVNVHSHNTVPTNDPKRLSGVRFGWIMDEKDWMVGCPVFVDDESKQKLGVDYECTII